MSNSRRKKSGRGSRAPLPDNALGLEVAWLADHPVHDVALRLEARATHDRATAVRVEQLHQLLVDLVTSHGPSAGSAMFVDVPVGERRDRQAAAVTVAVLSSVWAADRDGHLPSGRTARLLSPVEAAATRLCSTVSPLRATAVALSQAGAAPAQLTGPTPDDVAERDGTLHVHLPASRGYRARTVAVPAWATGHVQEAAEAARQAGHRLCLATPPGRGEVDRKAVTAHLVRALAVVGADATPDAIRLTTAHDALTAGGPPAAAQVLGTTRISAAQRLLAALPGQAMSPEEGT